MAKTTQVAQSPPDRLRRLLELRRRDEAASRELVRSWRELARPKQLPPPGDWNIWMVLAGRGYGKNWVGSHWLAEQVMTHPDSEWAILAPTFRDSARTCIEGSTGLLAALGRDAVTSYRRNELDITLANGAKIYGLSADRPERVRGPNLWGAWADELGSWRYPKTWYEALVPALRKGERPRIVVTTTPRPTALIRDLLGRDDGTVHVTRGSTWENAANLSPAALEELRRRYEGTRLGRQELEGELLEDIEGALWSRDQIDADRVTAAEVPDLTRIVVAIDPAVTSTAHSDETGLVVVGHDDQGHGYVLGDHSLRASPERCMRKAVDLYRQYDADRVVAEVNNGGDFIGNLLRTVDGDVPYSEVTATRGKAVRAEPVSALYEQHRVHHVGCLPQLEDELCTWVPGDALSPGRLDALVWACTELRGLSQPGSFHTQYGTTPDPCSKCDRRFQVKGPDGQIRTRCPFCGTAVPDQ